VGYGSRVRIPDETRTGKDERRIPRFVAKPVRNAVKFYVDVLAVAVRIREIRKHADLLVDVEDRQHVPSVSTCPMARGAFRELVNVTTPHRTPILRLRYRAVKRCQTNQKRYTLKFHNVSLESKCFLKTALCLTYELHHAERLGLPIRTR